MLPRLPPTQQQLWNFLRLQQRKPGRLFLYQTDGSHIPDFLFAGKSRIWLKGPLAFVGHCCLLQRELLRCPVTRPRVFPCDPVPSGPHSGCPSCSIHAQQRGILSFHP